jgi:hypothetical protein
LCSLCPPDTDSLSRKISQKNFCKKIFPAKKYSGKFPKKKFKKIKNFSADPGTGIPAPHDVNPLKNTPSVNTVFPFRTTPNPGHVRALIPHFSGTELYTGPDWDPPTPCLVRKSWKFFTNTGSGRSHKILSFTDVKSTLSDVNPKAKTGVLFILRHICPIPHTIGLPNAAKYCLISPT